MKGTYNKYYIQLIKFLMPFSPATLREDLRGPMDGQRFRDTVFAKRLSGEGSHSKYDLLYRVKYYKQLEETPAYIWFGLFPDEEIRQCFRQRVDAAGEVVAAVPLHHWYLNDQASRTDEGKYIVIYL